MKDITLYKQEHALYFKKINTKKDVDKEENVDGYLLETNEQEARRIIDSLKGKRKKIAFMGGDNTLNRRALETLKINYLVSPEKGNKKDTVKQRDSGLNHVLTRIAAAKNISIIIDMNDISSLKGKKLAERLARIKQNITLSKKTECNIQIASLSNKKQEDHDEHARQAFGLSLGMTTAQAKQAVTF